MRELYVGKNKLGNDVVYVKTIYGVYRYHPDRKVFVECLYGIEHLKELFNLELKRVLKDGERVSDIVHYSVTID